MTYASECGSKVRYMDRKAAKLAIRRMKSRDHNGRLNAYRCSQDACVFWHVGHVAPHAREHAQLRRHGAS